MYKLVEIPTSLSPYLNRFADIFTKPGRVVGHAKNASWVEVFLGEEEAVFTSEIAHRSCGIG